jgi:hypothetical protein
MSDQLAVSAAFSVLIMAIYVLFGTDAAQAPLAHDSLMAPVHAAMPDMPETSRLLPLVR